MILFDNKTVTKAFFLFKIIKYHLIPVNKNIWHIHIEIINSGIALSVITGSRLPELARLGADSFFELTVQKGRLL